ncbi:hypothetical protein ENUP19_0291G0005 [Entamoeba nuttalli]|uniref:Uncharacterized protein n=2 Tax=Entamoeba nuttalli TaxID=412467 RepID=K2HB57_ENTNP|nr:hypothetical protein ENU1_110840 [Entamoeba nuttalli P19]EKE39909.1 hypothetical protein ENU1_110840 [Entamoeba nuttalli P19]|eukprot:XP_008857759.1 hypothetical protein ENU1_110840 [Entamoeba nuttalli P19]
MTFHCKQCHNLLFRKEDLVLNSPLQFSKCENIIFKESLRVALPVLEMRCSRCDSVIGIVQQKPMLFVPDTEAIIESLITPPIELENFSEQIDNTPLSQEDNLITHYITSAFYWGALLLPLGLALFGKEK